MTWQASGKQGDFGDLSNEAEQLQDVLFPFLRFGVTIHSDRINDRRPVAAVPRSEICRLETTNEFSNKSRKLAISTAPSNREPFSATINLDDLTC